VLKKYRKFETAAKRADAGTKGWLKYLALAVLVALGLAIGFGMTSSSVHAGTTASPITIGLVSCDLPQYNPTHFAIQPGQTASCTIQTGLAPGTQVTVYVSGVEVATGTVAPNGTVAFQYTAPEGLCGTTTDIQFQVSGQPGKLQAFAGFAFVLNQQGECVVPTTTTTTTTPTTTTMPTTPTTTTTPQTGKPSINKTTVVGNTVIPMPSGIFKYTVSCSGQSVDVTLNDPLQQVNLDCNVGDTVTYIEHHLDGWQCENAPNPANSAECIVVLTMATGGVTANFKNQEVATTPAPTTTNVTNTTTTNVTTTTGTTTVHDTTTATTTTSSPAPPAPPAPPAQTITVTQTVTGPTVTTQGPTHTVTKTHVVKVCYVIKNGKRTKVNCKAKPSKHVSKRPKKRHFTPYSYNQR
jgi:hypothetical protein